MATETPTMAEFWEAVAARLGIIHHEIHMKFINMPDVAQNELLMTKIMVAAVHAKQLRDVAIIEEWERNLRMAGAQAEGQLRRAKAAVGL